MHPREPVPDFVYEKVGPRPREVTRFGSSRVWVGEGRVLKIGPAERAAREAFVLGVLPGSLPLLVPELIESGEGWLLMEAPPGPSHPVTRSMRGEALADLADLHSAFEGHAHLEDPRLNDVAGRDFTERLSLARKHTGGLPRPLQDAVAAPERLLELVAEDEVTLVHGDAWPGNVAVVGNGQRFWFDWEEAGRGWAAADLTTCVDGTPWVPGSPTPAEDLLAYVDRRGRLEPARWRLKLDAMCLFLFLLLDLPALASLAPASAKAVIDSRTRIAVELGY